MYNILLQAQEMPCRKATSTKTRIETDNKEAYKKEENSRKATSNKTRNETRFILSASNSCLKSRKATSTKTRIETSHQFQFSEVDKRSKSNIH